ncbi:hypothetical protein SH1V18_20850 [Vallitalea longa]|uniref:Uncharacterized protein n=1 Tax=Vallitalea longa TaxID=2936439 RepID=A0A9W5Y997_9FIRM|nr:hypothetical protein [Vallitalea longa]GKX29605.1 hypothetical protein SH1V18_20850 [Vallitalea longa]
MNKIKKHFIIGIIILILVLCTSTYLWYKTRPLYLPKQIDSIIIEYGQYTYTSNDPLFIENLLEVCDIRDWKKADKPKGDLAPEFHIVINNIYLLSFTSFDNEDIGFCVASNKEHTTNILYGGGYRFSIHLYNRIKEYTISKIDNN